MASFYETITEAINDIAEHGYDTQKRIDDWMVKIRKAAMDSLIPEYRVEQAISATMKDIYKRMITKGKILEFHPGVGLFTLNMIKPKLRNQLDRAIMANANLIKLNREAAIETTIRRFSGWATSIQPGGSDVIAKQEQKKLIRKSLSQMPYEERRVAIDQGHKLISSLNSIIANEQGALGAIWRSRWRRMGYNYREDHKERDGKFFMLRDNWAQKKGFMKVGKYGYIDGQTLPAQEPFCSCSYQYVYNLTDIPEEMLTEKGRKALEGALVS